jgi:integrase
MIRVKLRTKPIKGNLLSLYYDYYPAIKASDTHTATRREFTGKFIYSPVEYEFKEFTSSKGITYKSQVPVLDKAGKPKKRKLTAEQFKYNQETFDDAKQGETTRQGMINKGDHSFLPGKAKTLDFVVFCENLAKEKTGSTAEGWTSAIKHLKRHTGGSLPIGNLNKSFCEGFKKYLLANCSNNTASTYFNKFKAALREAYTTDPQILTTDLSALIEAIPEEETQIEYLTTEELQAAINTPFPELHVMKNAAIFSALTSLRWSDIQKLTWSEIQSNEASGYYIALITKKNKKAPVLPIPKSAVSVELIGQRKNPEDLVFPGLAKSTENNNKMRTNWLNIAGITKHITFHSFRHTWRTLQQERGTDIYTQSKMLTHSDLKTTQIYSEIRNPGMVAAARRMDNFDLSALKSEKTMAAHIQINYPDILSDSDRCYHCLNYWGELKCFAFPHRIPTVILTGAITHDKPIPGQGNDIVFEADKTTST